MDLVQLCETELACTFEHTGGHAMPVNTEELEGICNVVETAVGRGIGA